MPITPMPAGDITPDGAEVASTYPGPMYKDAAETGAILFAADSADRSALIATVAERGVLDVLVVNAGVSVSGDPLTPDADEVDRMVDINVRAPYHAAVEAARRMNDGGRILVIGSVNGDRVRSPGPPPLRLPSQRCGAWCVASPGTSVAAVSP